MTGLVAARQLSQCGHDVTVFESGDRVGGQIRTEQIAGFPVDVGAEALHMAGPHISALRSELDFGSDEVVANTGTAWIWSGDRLRPLPAGVGPTGPTRLWPVLNSRILSPRGLARAAFEPVIQRTRHSGDEAVGEVIARRFGREVTDRLVDPLLGSLHAGDVRRLSIRAATPYLASQMAGHRSMILAARSRKGTGAPSFVSFNGGLATFTDALLAGTGVALQLNTPVSSLTKGVGGYRLRLSSERTDLSGRAIGDGSLWDGVVVATPSAVASRILAAPAPAASAGLAELISASVATVVLAFPRSEVEPLVAFGSTGMLVPSGAGRLLKAATFLSRKWPHLSGDDVFLIRMSAGRARSQTLAGMDDEELVRALRADLGDATGLRAAHIAEHVSRWPDALPQLEVGHLDRMATIRRGLEHLPGVTLAGAAYGGLGIAACVSSGVDAATRLHEYLNSEGEAA